VFAPDRLAALARRPYWRVKRSLDIAGALLAGAIALPIGVLASFLLALEIGPHVIFWQQRPGLGGRPFRLYKLRTMAAAHDEHGRLRTEAERILPIGSFMRRTRLDELPQLYNILRGDMSFVGPRPLLPVDQGAEHAARLLVRPGLTGWAQVTGGRTISAADKAALDVWYVRNASLPLDLRILVRTAHMVLRGESVQAAAIDRAWRELSEEGICTATAGGVVRAVPQAAA
jgi:lipopolysaccharide/colanic/teichoic acid biosynthesis glycosyltransferase